MPFEIGAWCRKLEEHPSPIHSIRFQIFLSSKREWRVIKYPDQVIISGDVYIFGKNVERVASKRKAAHVPPGGSRWDVINLQLATCNFQQLLLCHHFWDLLCNYTEDTIISHTSLAGLFWKIRSSVSNDFANPKAAHARSQRSWLIDATKFFLVKVREQTTDNLQSIWKKKYSKIFIIWNLSSISADDRTLLDPISNGHRQYIACPLARSTGIAYESNSGVRI